MPRRKKSWLHRRLNLSHHKHTGKRLPWSETSLGLLIIALIFTGFVLGYASSAQAQTNQSLNGSVVVSGVVPITTENSQPTSIKTAEHSDGSQTQGFNFSFISRNGFLTFLWTIFSAFFGALTFVWIASKSAFIKVLLWKTISP
jgi:hypothetical protein